jgi:exosome complex RNA-binding protein Rrp42 (RNase PH superfamily)
VLKASENYVRKLVEEGMRIDERKSDQFREVMALESSSQNNTPNNGRLTLLKCF